MPPGRRPDGILHQLEKRVTEIIRPQCGVLLSTSTSARCSNERLTGRYVGGDCTGWKKAAYGRRVAYCLSIRLVSISAFPRSDSQSLTYLLTSTLSVCVSTP